MDRVFITIGVKFLDPPVFGAYVAYEVRSKSNDVQVPIRIAGRGQCRIFAGVSIEIFIPVYGILGTGCRPSRYRHSPRVYAAGQAKQQGCSGIISTAALLAAAEQHSPRNKIRQTTLPVFIKEPSLNFFLFIFF